MDHTVYTDSSGWDQGTVSTAADQLRVFQQAMRFPVFDEIVSTPSVTLPVAATLTNTNPLIAELRRQDRLGLRSRSVSSVLHPCDHRRGPPDRGRCGAGPVGGQQHIGRPGRRRRGGRAANIVDSVIPADAMSTGATPGVTGDQGQNGVSQGNLPQLPIRRRRAG